jgi:hypothetical protein
MNDRERLSRIERILLHLLKGLCPEEYERWSARELEQINIERDIERRKLELLEKMGGRLDPYEPHPGE